MFHNIVIDNCFHPVIMCCGCLQTIDRQSHFASLTSRSSWGEILVHKCAEIHLTSDLHM